MDAIYYAEFRGALRLRRAFPFFLATVVAVMLAVAVPGPAAAEEPGTGAAAPRETDAMDLVGKLRHKKSTEETEREAKDPRSPVLIFSPIIASSPSTGLVLGGGASLSFFRGDPETTFVSSVNGGLSFSINKQMAVSGMLSFFTEDNRWFVQAEPRWTTFPEYAYDLGTDSPPSSEVNVQSDRPKVLLTGYRQLHRGLFAGLGVEYGAHTDIRPGKGYEDAWEGSSFVEYSLRHGLDLSSQTSAGVSGNVFFDNRDSAINASRGWFALASYRVYEKGFLGGSCDWKEAYVDLRTYKTIKKGSRHRLAFWLNGAFVTDGVAPFFDLPATGTAVRGRPGRGYKGGRFRGERLIYGEVEYRAGLTRNGLLGMVVFANTETVSNREAQEELFDSAAMGGGVGFRLLLDKKSKMNFCLDLGFGEQGSRGVYVGIREAF